VCPSNQPDFLTKDEQNFKLQKPEPPKPKEKRLVGPDNQLNTRTVDQQWNYEFYKLAFDNRKDAKLSDNLIRIACAIQMGWVVSSSVGKGVVLQKGIPDFGPCESEEDNGSRIRFWRVLLRNADLREIGKGTFNRTLLVNNTPESILSLEDYKAAFRTGGTNSGKIALRIGTAKSVGDDSTESHIVKEIYTTAYASYYDIGPQLIASYYTTDQAFYTLVNESREVVCDDILNKHKLTSTFNASVAWDGDCHNLIKQNWNHKNFPNRFGELFIDLVVKAANVGVFHADMKPNNLLFCMEAGRLDDSQMSQKIPEDFSTLKLCMTDFDPTYVNILTPSERSSCKNCVIVASVCMLLGFLRCYHGESVWKAMRNGMRNKLSEVIGYESDKIVQEQPGTLCNFLQNSLILKIRTCESNVDQLEQKLKDADARLNSYPVGTARTRGIMLPAFERRRKDAKVAYEKASDELQKLINEEQRLHLIMENVNNYSGQQEMASYSWQKHVGHYLTKENYFKQNWKENAENGRKFLKLAWFSDNIYDQVVAYALEEEAMEGSLKRPIEILDSQSPHEEPILLSS
tara:strand:+ start:5999 stop:7717 length:1719 start_codon:yes stop_codon:yes gene_type:complete